MITERINWKRAKFTTRAVTLTMEDEQTKTIEAEVIGNIAVHAADEYTQGKYMMTHIPTGFAIRPGIGSKRNIRRAARYWAHVMANINTQDEAYKSKRCTRANKVWLRWARFR